MKKFVLGVVLAVAGRVVRRRPAAARRPGRRVRGVVAKTHPKDYDDATLKDKVESELFRDEHEVKGVDQHQRAGRASCSSVASSRRRT